MSGSATMNRPNTWDCVIFSIAPSPAEAHREHVDLAPAIVTCPLGGCPGVLVWRGFAQKPSYMRRAIGNLGIIRSKMTQIMGTFRTHFSPQHQHSDIGKGVFVQSRMEAYSPLNPWSSILASRRSAVSKPSVNQP